jgi:filamentous hemagglutinin family protein
VSIKQTAPQALLTWQTFNIGKETTLTFDQTAGGANVSQWIAFNKVNDPTGVPSQILGSIQALGQVYVINQNGIIFGGSSQVNTHALVASSLPINDNLISRGLLNNPDQQFLFSQLTIPVASQGTMPAFVPPALPGGLTRNGDVIVQSGALLSSPTTADHVGGRIALVGPNVRNEGTISTPDGQTILAAGQQVGMVAHASSDPSLRGLDVFIGTVNADSGTATNVGLISVPRGNTTIAGKDVNQLGIVDSSTSVALNGRIDLLADYNSVVVRDLSANTFSLNPTASGHVTLGAGSVTQILPELASLDKVVGSTLALRSMIKMQGETIHLEGNSQVLAPNAQVELNAGRWQLVNPAYVYTYTDGQVYLDAGSSIDVGGTTDVSAPVSSNIVAVELRGAELADVALQRFGALRGQSILIDIRESGLYNGQSWIGTPLADARGYVNLVQRPVGELTTEGGSVSIKAGGSVVLQAGSQIDVSGGWINYQGGVVQTTKVISNGHIYDISQATPDRIYDGLDNGSTTVHPKWGVTENWGSSLMSRGVYQNSYIYGVDGGTISIIAPTMAIDGALLGQTVAGPRQRAVQPTPGALSMAFLAQEGVNFQFISPAHPTVTWQEGVTLPAAGPFSLDVDGHPFALQVERRDDVILNPDLVNLNGFGSVQINNPDGDIRLAAGEILNLGPGGSVSWKGANIDIGGTITAPGGSLSFQADNVTLANRNLAALNPSNFTTAPAPEVGRGQITVGSSARLDTAGILVDDRAGTPTAGTQPLFTTGGAISLTGYDVTLENGAVLNVNGGAVVDSKAKVTYGDAGSLTIVAGQDPNAIFTGVVGGHLQLGATMTGYSGAKGGLLSIQAPAVQIGGSSALTDTLVLGNDFFDQGGFAGFSLTGLGYTTGTTSVTPVLVSSGTQLAPQIQNLNLLTDSLGGISLIPILRPDEISRSPLNLTLNAKGVRDALGNGLLLSRGDLVFEAGASISAGAKGNIVLKGQTVSVEGALSAPGGSIAITGASTFPLLNATDPATQALPTVYLGPKASLSTAGQALMITDARGQRTGSILPGGSITVTGNIVAEAGAVLNVSGAAGWLDLLPSYTGSIARTNGELNNLPVATRVESNGGSITLTGKEELFTDATLIGAAGGTSALGGTLSISSGRFVPTGAPPQTLLDVTLLVTQNGLTIPVPFAGTGQTAIGQPVLGLNLVPLTGQGYFAADRFNGSGFDSLVLGGTVQFTGAVTITAPYSLTVGSSGVIYSDAVVNLNAPYVALGMPFRGPLTPAQQAEPIFTVGGQPFYVPPTYGSGTLNVAAQLIDLGNLSLQNIGAANFVAENGDIRGDGTLEVAGAILLRAGQVYPTTGTRFTIAAYDHAGTPGSVTIAAAGDRPLPFSAGGQLNIYGSVINQGGVLRAPFGTITLGWDGTGSGPVDILGGGVFTASQQVTLASGSVTSVSAIDPTTGEGLILPYGTILNGVSWIDPAGIDITTTGVPAKAIKISAANVDDQAGALIDIQGGGDLYSYRWLKGTGGTQDILASSTAFAVIPGYRAGYAPLDQTIDHDGAHPYLNTALKVGDRIHLGASAGLPEGDYTLLPARYALLPGAFLVTPQNGAPANSVLKPDGATVVSGYRSNGLSVTQTGRPVLAAFEVAPAAVVRARSEYEDSLANTFMLANAVARNVEVTRLPIDAGQLILASTQSLILKGTVASLAQTGGRGSLVDIGSPSDILIAGPGATAAPGVLVLDSVSLSAFGADSLLIGGFRQIGANGTTITVTTNHLTVDNAGSPLSGPDIILTSKQNLTLAAGAEVTQLGALSGSADTLLIGQATVAGSGDGAVLRVSSDPAAQVIRSGVDSSTIPSLVVGAGARITGISLLLDSTYGTDLDPTAILSGQSVSLGSGQISVQLTNPGALQLTTGLVLSNTALQTLLTTTQNLSLLSYSSIDFYGTGSIGSQTGVQPFSLNRLALHAAEIRGLNTGGGTVDLIARDISLDNSPGRTLTPVAVATSGTLALKAETIHLGANALRLERYADVTMTASQGVMVEGTGALATAGSLHATTPVITGQAGANHSITAAGDLVMMAPSGGSTTSLVSGLGASLALQGSSVTADSDILLPSGTLKITAVGGDLTVGGKLDVSGTARNFYDQVKYTNGGQIVLNSVTGSVTLDSGSTVNVAAQTDGGDAGRLSISAPNGIFALGGTISGLGGTGGQAGNFSLDVGQLPATGLLNAALNTAGFTQTRSIRVRNGNVLIDGVATAHTFTLSADQGSIQVTGLIDASGAHGGTINLYANHSLTLDSSARLTVKGQAFNEAGKGGDIHLEAGAQRNGVVDAGALLTLSSGAQLDLSVVANNAASAGLGQFTGTLHLRAPQTGGATDLQMAALDATVVNASSIQVEGYQVIDLTPGSGSVTITATVQNNVLQNGLTFGGNSSAIASRLLANNGGLNSVLVVTPGTEILNRVGDLVLGATNSTAASDWDLHSYRFGPNGAPGVLTLRAAGNLTFYNAISDGFSSAAYNASLMTANGALPINTQSWSYRFTAGADMAAADFHQVLAASALAANSGHINLGKNNGTNASNSNGQTNTPGANATTVAALVNRYQVIRTGTGDIDLSAGGDIRLLNQFASIFTAGVALTTPTTVINPGDFDLPILAATTAQQGNLGAVQQNPFSIPQYSLAGGNVTLQAQNDIIHLTLLPGATTLTLDSSREMPYNWLYRRGYVDASGLFGLVTRNGVTPDVGSTTWWVDFSNFFEGVGALGGGNVTLTAGRDVANVDAVAPTNARMSGKDALGNRIAPDEANLVELGGGNVTVQAGRNIDGGAYYVERGEGTLTAGNEIKTNSARAPFVGPLAGSSPNNPASPSSDTWLPTTLFLGKGHFEASSRGDLILGPIANVFLLPQSVNNTFWYKTYFSTYASGSGISLSSLSGDVTLKENLANPSGSDSLPLLYQWLNSVSVLRTTSGAQSVSFYQPWLRLSESNVTPFKSLATLLPGTLKATSFAGDINVVGDLTLTPSPTGTIELTAAGSLNGLSKTGTGLVQSVAQPIYATSTINLSDADPRLIPGINSPFAFRSTLSASGAGVAAPNTTPNLTLFNSLNSLFAETGSTVGAAAVLQSKQALHAPGVLHTGDSSPVRLYALEGDISGVTLFSGKAGQIFAGNDITDIAFYLQNITDQDVSMISAGHDIIAYNSSSVLRSTAVSSGLAAGFNPQIGAVLNGDMQISGPGTLEVLAGRNLDLGLGSNNADGTGVGITSIGSARNPYLPFTGADVVAGAGLGLSFGLSHSPMDFTNFVAQVLSLPAGSAYLAELGTDLVAFNLMSTEQQNLVALDVFSLILRDAGRNHNNPDSEGFGNYDAGLTAILTLFPGIGTGNITTQARDIRTKSGGDIVLLALGGGVTLAATTLGNTLAPPGIITEAGGDISIFTDGDVNIGISRIFTLRGGNEIIWSTNGDIAAGSSSKTVQSAPPTRVVVDPQSGDVKTDLAGLATGGGIGVLDTVAGVTPGNVDLIAVSGTVDAGDAGIRSSGNLNIAAVQVLNASNIQAGGSNTGGTVAAPAAPNIGGLTSGSNTSAAASSSATEAAKQAQNQGGGQQELPSIITVEVLGYGGSTDDEDDDENKPKKNGDQEKERKTAQVNPPLLTQAVR